MRHRELPKINFNFQSSEPLMYIELDVIKCCYLHFRCFCYLTLPDKICLLLYAEYVKHPLLQNIISVRLEEPTNPDSAKVYFFLNNSKENKGLSLQMETQGKQDHSKGVE